LSFSDPGTLAAARGSAQAVRATGAAAPWGKRAPQHLGIGEADAQTAASSVD
jgi:hypothetical protein